MSQHSSTSFDRLNHTRRLRLPLPLEALEARLCLSSAIAPAYLPSASVAAGPTPTAVVTDDFDQDGNEDMAIAQGSNNSVAILLGNGDGTFAVPSEFRTGADPTSLATGDFNNDGVDDIVTADAGSGDISILLGQADNDGNALGTFGTPRNIHVESPGTGPMFVAVGDFDNDGNLDVAVAGSNGLYVLLGNGGGAFSAPHLVARGNFSGGVVADTFTQSGNTDVAALDPSTGMVEVFAGNGDGTFAAPSSYSVGASASSIASGDFNNDGAEDIAVTLPGQNTVEVLLQNSITVTVPGADGYTYTTGAGTFAAPRTIQLDQSPSSLFLDDVNEDGNLDIVTANTADDSLTVIPGNGDGTFAAPLDIPVGSTPVGVAVDDFIGDGEQDLVSANSSDGTASVVLQQPSDVAVSLAASTPYAVDGSLVTYTATISNNGPGPATGVTFDDYLPSNLTFVSATGSEGTLDITDPTNINLTLPSLANGATATVTIIAKATQYGPADNSVWVSCDSIDSNYNNDNAIVSTPVTGATGAEVVLTSDSSRYFFPISAPISTGSSSGASTTSVSNSANIPIGLPVEFGWVTVGQDYTYSFTVNNYGPDTASDLNFNDALPAGMTFVSATASQGTINSSTPGTVSADLGDLASGASATVNITIKPTAAGSITDSASVFANPDTDPYLSDNSATVTTYVSDATGPVPVLFAGAAATGTNAKSPALPTLAVSGIRNTNVITGKTDFEFTVTRSGNLTSPSTVKFSTVGGTAKAGTKFQAVSGQLSFAAGAKSETVSVPVKGSKKYSADKTFVLSLSDPTNASLKNSRATATIVSAVAPPGAPNPFAKGVGINFEPAGGPVFEGYLQDTGLVFGSRGNGFTYGWSTNNTASAVTRTPVKDARHDTFNVLGTGGSPNWQISLPNGRYRIKLVAGDPSNSTNTYQVDANSSLILTGKAIIKRPFVAAATTININNGVLELTPDSRGSSNDLDFVKISYLGALK
ncbi:MAG TPA: FG-GAP-like repeat-containing protein [Tepidisphaeraceae bacterium]|jgi:uncharacterized repeat protein (TIGR01451 family)